MIRWAKQKDVMMPKMTGYEVTQKIREKWQINELPILLLTAKNREEVGGDYYDVLVHAGGVKIGIGDVTGHGLESGVLAMMVQTAVRTLLIHGETDAIKFLATINRIIYDNAQRMGIDHNLTLCLLDWQENRLRISGQHEEVLIIRDGHVERVDTLDLGFIIGLEPEITAFITEKTLTLNPNDVVILYSDGVTEAENSRSEFYGIERLCTIGEQCWQKSTSEIKQTIINDIHQFMGKKQLQDDVTLVVLKQR
jgi:sigma-B regulation protein RsbU (phosphoserine phosphatase)